jgi:3-deoxy-7-phosphoheptulonate synthase
MTMLEPLQNPVPERDPASSPETGWTALPTPEEIVQGMPLSPSAQQFRATTVKTLQRALRAEGFIAIVGPCSLHHFEGALRYADRLAALREELPSHWVLVMRSFYEKSRSANGWKGLLYGGEQRTDIATGLWQTRRLLIEILERGIGTASELLSPLAFPYMKDLLCWGCIGARTVRSQIHRELASGAPFPVGFKNALSGDVRAALQSAWTASQSQAQLGIGADGRTRQWVSPGNANAHVVLRGGAEKMNLTAENLELCRNFANSHGLPPKVLVDCSHGNSGRDPSKQQHPLFATTIYADAVAGVMVESYHKYGAAPDRGALSCPDYSITDPCLDWPTTRRLLLDLAHQQSRHHRDPSSETTADEARPTAFVHP